MLRVPRKQKMGLHQGSKNNLKKSFFNVNQPDLQIDEDISFIQLTTFKRLYSVPLTAV